MKRFLLLLTTFALTISCSAPKKPVLKYVDNIEVKNVSMRNITLTANAIFNNPNSVRGTLSIEDFHVFVDNIDMGTIFSQEFNVPAKREFTVPLTGTFSLSKIYKKNKNTLLESVFKVVQTDSLDIRYTGVIRYHLGNFSYPYNIDKQKKVHIR